MAFTGTHTPLIANETFTSDTRLSDRQDTINGSVKSDQSGVLHVDQSPDGTNWDIDTSFNVSGTTGQGFSVTVYAPFWRLRYINGASPQAYFRLTARNASAGDS